MTTRFLQLLQTLLDLGCHMGLKLMNVQNAQVNVHVVYLIFDLVDIPSRIVSKYGLTSAIKFNYLPTQQSELTPTLGPL